jgi:hypothetical protein
MAHFALQMCQCKICMLWNARLINTIPWYLRICHFVCGVFRLRMKWTASWCGRHLRIYWISRRGQPISGYSLASGMGEELTTLCRKHFMLQIVPKVLKLSRCFGTKFSRWGQMAGSCEHSIKPSGSEKSGDFLDSQNNYGLLKKD